MVRLEDLAEAMDLDFFKLEDRKKAVKMGISAHDMGIIHNLQRHGGIIEIGEGL